MLWMDKVGERREWIIAVSRCCRWLFWIVEREKYLGLTLWVGAVGGMVLYYRC